MLRDPPSGARERAGAAEAVALTRGGLLARNVAWNMAGVALPTLAAVAAIPILVDTLGDARFGLLSLAWMFIGYFTIFDLGLSLALTRIISARLSEAGRHTLPALVGTALAVATLLAASSGVLVWCTAARIVTDVMDVPAQAQAEALSVLKVLALAIPFVILGSVLRGVLEAFQRFDLVNMVRLANGLYLFIGPLLVLPFTSDMGILVGVLAAGKAAATLVFAVFCVRLVPDLRQRLHWSIAELRVLLVFGGWVTAGNIIGPLLTYTDQFMIGSLVSIALVSFYLVPYQMITKLWVVTTAVVGVLFPAMSILLVSDPAAARRLFLLGVKSVVVIVAPIALLISAFAEELLTLWLGEAYGRASTTLLQVFAVGVLINAFSFVTLAFVQAAGKPDWVPKLFMCELPLYVPALYWAIDAWELTGAVAVWLAKIVVDFLFLMWACTRLMPELSRPMRSAGPGFMLLFGAFVPLTLGDFALMTRAILAATGVGLLLLVSWTHLIDAHERAMIAARLRAPFGRSTAADQPPALHIKKR